MKKHAPAGSRVLTLGRPLLPSPEPFLPWTRREAPTPSRTSAPSRALSSSYTATWSPPPSPTATKIHRVELEQLHRRSRAPPHRTQAALPPWPRAQDPSRRARDRPPLVRARADLQPSTAGVRGELEWQRRRGTGAAAERQEKQSVAIMQEGSWS